MTTKTITITDLSDVQEGDMVTAEYIPMSHERGARIVGEASRDAAGVLIVGGYVLRRPDGSKADTSLWFVSATREVPAWGPDEDEVRYLAQALAAASGAPASEWESWRAVATPMLTHMHDSGWLNDAPAESEPVDPVLDENDKRDRIDIEGDRWRWWGDTEVWKLGNHNARGNLAVIDRQFGPLRLANKDDEETDDE